MSQSDRLRAMDARFARAFTRSGFCDIASYFSKGVTTPNVHAMLDRGVQLIGDQSQVINDQITVTAFRAEIGKIPDRGDEFTIGTETFIVDSISEKDESAVVCIVIEKGCC